MPHSRLRQPWVSGSHAATGAVVTPVAIDVAIGLRAQVAQMPATVPDSTAPGRGRSVEDVVEGGGGQYPVGPVVQLLRGCGGDRRVAVSGRVPNFKALYKAVP